MSKKRVLVTGATGNLGRKAVAALSLIEGWQVIQIDKNVRGDPAVIAADLAHYDESWARHFADVDAVLHLAATPHHSGGWDSILPLNIDLALNVLRAAEAGGAGRFIFASSNWVLGGYRFRHERLDASLPPHPVNPYGSCKLFIERCGMASAAHNGMAFLSLRIGYCQPDENRPGAHMGYGRWGQEMWLGNRDWEQAAVKAVTAPFQGSAVINIVSRNDGMRWDLDAGRAALGYEPQERHSPVLSLAGRIKDFIARGREWLVPRGLTVPRFGAKW